MSWSRVGDAVKPANHNAVNAVLQYQQRHAVITANDAPTANADIPANNKPIAGTIGIGIIFVPLLLNC